MINTSKPESTQGWIVLDIYLDFFFKNLISYIYRVSVGEWIETNFAGLLEVDECTCLLNLVPFAPQVKELLEFIWNRPHLQTFGNN